MQLTERGMFEDYTRACAGITLLDDSQRPVYLRLAKCPCPEQVNPSQDRVQRRTQLV